MKFSFIEIDEFIDNKRKQFIINCSLHVEIQNLSDGVLAIQSNAGAGTIEINESIVFHGHPDAPLHGTIFFDFSQITNVKVKVRSSVMSKQSTK